MSEQKNFSYILNSYKPRNEFILNKDEIMNSKPIMTYNNITTNENNNNNINNYIIRSKSSSNNLILKNNNNSNNTNNTDDIYQKYINNNINTPESQIKYLIKENKDLQNELKKEKNQRKQDKKNMDILKCTINNLISQNKKDVINTSSPNKTYADLLLSIGTLSDENNNLNKKINDLISDKKVEKNEFEQTKNKLLNKEQEINDYMAKNEELNNKCQILESQAIRLTDNLKDFKQFEKIRALSESLEKELKIKNDENSNLKNSIKEKEQEINELKLMKYDERLLFLDQKFNEYKIKDQQNQIKIDKLNIELNDIKNKFSMTQKLLEERQNAILESRTNFEDNIFKYNNLKNNYDSLNNIKEKTIMENNDLKLKNTQINNELIQFRSNYMKYKEELKNLSMQLMIIKNEKNKNEIYFLNQISLLQKEKNYIENEYNKIKQKYDNINSDFQKNNTNNEINSTNSKYNTEMINKKYDLSLHEIKSYINDNKKLFDLSKKLKNDLNFALEEKEFYSNIINKILEGNYIDKTHFDFVTIIHKSIENFMDIQHLKKLKYEMNTKLKNYESIIKNMNKKPDSTGTGKSYEINKNFYDVDDFSEIGKIQNQIIIINDKLNKLDEQKSKIMKEFVKY